ncbi:hypothetical protein FOZ62_032065, partial [Perkinsus olseni]
MITFVPTWLVAFEVLATITAAQSVGDYVHEAANYRITFHVDEERRASFNFSITRPRIVHPVGQQFFGVPTSTSYQAGPYALHHIINSRYLILHLWPHEWYMGIEKALVDTGLADYGGGPPAGTQHGDLTQLQFKSGDSFVTNF